MEGQWNQDNDSLVFWMEGPLQPEQGYRLEVQGHIDNLSLYASQVFHFQSDNQTLDLNNGLVAYYPLDENPPVEKQSGICSKVISNCHWKTELGSLQSEQSLN